MRVLNGKRVDEAFIDRKRKRQIIKKLQERDAKGIGKRHKTFAQEDEEEDSQ